MGSNHSEYYENVKIVNVINEYTLEIEFYEDKEDKIKRNLVVTLKGIQPYDWTILEELNRSKKAQLVISSLQLFQKELCAEIFKKDIITPECILTEKKSGVNINHWLITMGHVRGKK